MFLSEATNEKIQYHAKTAGLAAIAGLACFLYVTPVILGVAELLLAASLGPTLFATAVYLCAVEPLYITGIDSYIIQASRNEASDKGKIFSAYFWLINEVLLYIISPTFAITSIAASVSYLFNSKQRADLLDAEISNHGPLTAAGFFKAFGVTALHNSVIVGSLILASFILPPVSPLAFIGIELGILAAAAGLSSLYKWAVTPTGPLDSEINEPSATQHKPFGPYGTKDHPLSHRQEVQLGASVRQAPTDCQPSMAGWPDWSQEPVRDNGQHYTPMYPDLTQELGAVNPGLTYHSEIPSAPSVEFSEDWLPQRNGNQPR